MPATESNPSLEILPYSATTALTNLELTWMQLENSFETLTYNEATA